MVFETILTFAALFYLRRWVHGQAANHPELSTFDAVDRLMQFAIVVASVWLCVAFVVHIVELSNFLNEVRSTLPSDPWR